MKVYLIKAAVERYLIHSYICPNYPGRTGPYRCSAVKNALPRRSKEYSHILKAVSVATAVENTARVDTYCPAPVKIETARIISVDILADDENAHEALVVVPDDQLSLAIGREGQNVRLAHKLTGWKIDIKNQTQAAQAEAAYRAEMENEAEEAENYEEDLPTEENDEENIVEEEYGIDEEDMVHEETSSDDEVQE